MTLGTGDKKKVGFLAALLLVAAYAVYSNVLSGPAPAPAPPSSAASAPAGVAAAAPAETAPAQQPDIRRAGSQMARGEGRGGEFHPVLQSKRPEDRIDPMSVDPTLRLDLLAKVQEQEPAGGTRNLFQFSTPPPPKPADLPKGPEPKVLPKSPGAQTAAAGAAGAKPPEPPPPPPPYKYYGYTTERDNGTKKAFFLNGDDILVAKEGDVLNNRYRLVRIGPTSAVFEDTQSKRQAPVPLVEEAGG